MRFYGLVRKSCGGLALLAAGIASGAFSGACAGDGSAGSGDDGGAASLSDDGSSVLDASSGDDTVTGDDTGNAVATDDSSTTLPEASSGDDSSAAPDTGAPPDAGDVVVDSGPSCPTCLLKVEYQNTVTATSTNEIKPHLEILNTGTSPQALSELTVRYWFTADATSTFDWNADYTQLTGLSANMMVSFPAMATAVTGADHYMEVAFTAAAGSIPANGSTGEIQLRFHRTGYASPNFDQSNDYSFAAQAAYADAMKIGLYRSGTLVWGVEPK